MFYEACQGAQWNGEQGPGHAGLRTLAAALVGGQLEAGVTGALVTAQCVDTALFAPPIVWLGALVHLCGRREDKD